MNCAELHVIVSGVTSERGAVAVHLGRRAIFAGAPHCDTFGLSRFLQTCAKHSRFNIRADKKDKKNRQPYVHFWMKAKDPLLAVVRGFKGDFLKSVQRPGEVGVQAILVVQATLGLEGWHPLLCVKPSSNC